MCSIVSRVSGCWTRRTWTAYSGPKNGEGCQRSVSEAQLECGDEVDEKTWTALVDASFCLGDRTLYLRMPHFHGHDVQQLQKALSALGFACGDIDGIFGAFTELALRKFQTNLGLPTDGIAGAYTDRLSVTCIIPGGQGSGARLFTPGLRTRGRRARAQRVVPVRHAGVHAQRGLAHEQPGACHQPRIEDRQRRQPAGGAR